LQKVNPDEKRHRVSPCGDRRRNRIRNVRNWWRDRSRPDIWALSGIRSAQSARNQPGRLDTTDRIARRAGLREGGIRLLANGRAANSRAISGRHRRRKNREAHRAPPDASSVCRASLLTWGLASHRNVEALSATR